MMKKEEVMVVADLARVDPGVVVVVVVVVVVFVHPHY